MSNGTLDQLAEQAQQAARQCAAYLLGQQTRPHSVAFTIIIREALEVVTQALREQLAEAKSDFDAFAEHHRATEQQLAHVAQDLEAARFRPLGDNHHNAAACPHCRPTLETERAQLAQAMQELAEAEVHDRLIMWLNHGCTGMYGDDGEMQCNEAHPNGDGHVIGPLDFKRQPIESLHLAMLSMLRYQRRRAEAAESALTAQREDLERYRAALELARGLPFCGHRDCEGGQHPGRNCIGCETLWERWREALAACTPTKSSSA